MPYFSLGQPADVCLSVICSDQASSKQAQAVCGMLMTLITSFWGQKRWFLDLPLIFKRTDMGASTFYFIPLQSDPLRQPHFHRFHQETVQ